MKLDVRCPKCQGITFAASIADEKDTYIVMEHIAPNGQWCSTAEVIGKANLDFVDSPKGPDPSMLITPAEWIDVLGPFDLDPCATPAPRPWPTANEHWDDNGLEREWHGFVWCNPTGLNVDRWFARLAEHGNGIGLVGTRLIETQWFERLIWAKADTILIPTGRPYLHTLSGERAKRDFGSGVALVGYGALATRRLLEAPIDGNCLTDWVQTKAPKEI